MEWLQAVGIGVGIAAAFVFLVYLMAGWRPGITRYHDALAQRDEIIGTLDQINETLAGILDACKDSHTEAEFIAKDVSAIRDNTDRIK